jgi:hypothetical protein
MLGYETNCCGSEEKALFIAMKGTYRNCQEKIASLTPVRATN